MTGFVHLAFTNLPGPVWLFFVLAPAPVVVLAVWMKIREPLFRRPYMRKTKALLAILSFSLLLLLVGCSKSGSQYIGKWQTPQNTKDQIEIVRNGDNFLIAFSGHDQQLPAVVKDGSLLMSGSGAAFTYIKATDKLTMQAPLMGIVELSRVK